PAGQGHRVSRRPRAGPVSGGEVSAVRSADPAFLDALLDHDRHPRDPSVGRHPGRRGGRLALWPPCHPGAGFDHGGRRHLLPLRRLGVAGRLSPAVSRGAHLSDRANDCVPSVWELAKGPLAVWLVLIVLLAISAASAYVPLGPFNAAFNLLIAAV